MAEDCERSADGVGASYRPHRCYLGRYQAVSESKEVTLENSRGRAAGRDTVLKPAAKPRAQG